MLQHVTNALFPSVCVLLYSRSNCHRRYIININDCLCSVKMHIFILYVSVNCLIQVMNMYGDLVMDSVPDKVQKTHGRSLLRHFTLVWCLSREMQ